MKRKIQDLLNKGYRFCKNNEEKINKKANKTYEMVTKNKKQKLTENSCDFIMLEKACMEYKKRNTQRTGMKTDYLLSLENEHALIERTSKHITDDIVD